MVSLTPVAQALVHILDPGEERFAPTILLTPFPPRQLIASAYILNHAPEPNSIPLYPYLHSLSNIRSREDLLTPCYLPDVNPNEIAGGPADFSFAAGDFLEVYGDAPGT